MFFSLWCHHSVDSRLFQSTALYLFIYLFIYLFSSLSKRYMVWCLWWLKVIFFRLRNMWWITLFQKCLKFCRSKEAIKELDLMSLYAKRRYSLRSSLLCNSCDVFFDCDTVVVKLLWPTALRLVIIALCLNDTLLSAIPWEDQHKPWHHQEAFALCSRRLALVVRVWPSFVCGIWSLFGVRPYRYIFQHNGPLLDSYSTMGNP